MDSVNRKNGYFPGTFFKRSNRIVVASNGVFIRVREGKMVGPFSTFREAELNLREFIRKVDSSASISSLGNAQSRYYTRP